ncbi:MAG: transposase [Isosphaeraceae bacterium]
MDIQGPDLHGDPLGVVRREDPHGPLLPRPKGRRGNRDPRADTRDVVPGLPQNVEDLDSRAHQRPGWSPFANACRPTLQTGSRSVDFRSSAWTAAVSNCPAPSPTKSDFRPPRREGGRKSKPRRKPRRRARSQAARARRAREKKTNSPQMWLTVMFHVGTGLPWDWRTGPSDSSERDHLRQMINALPAGALVTADAGFVGYEYWKALIESGRHLLIRVGANVRLLKNLGYVKERNGLVYLWPDREAARNQPPLVLRLVVAQGGKHPVYLVTSVLDEATLSDKQVVEIYALRWGVELFYRHFKQTFERRKLRSRSADNAELERTWSLLGLWAMSLHAQVELARDGVPARRISVAKVLRAYRKSLREYKSVADPGESLRELVSKAVIDPYKRANKSSRDYPRKKHGHAIGAPEILNATKDQINAARKLRGQLTSGLTA